MEASSIVEKTIKGAKPFTDQDFAPNKNSLLDPDQKNAGLDKSSADIFAKAVWKRSNQIWPIGLSLFPKGGIKPGQIIQGRLADCYFLSALDALADKINLEDLFLVKKINTAGIYAVKLFMDGNWVEVIVDDFLPCDAKTGSLIFAESKTQEPSMWVSLLEKAWAKLHGSYCLTRLGSTLTALIALTGLSVNVIDHQTTTKDCIWELMRNEVNLACADDN